MNKIQKSMNLIAAAIMILGVIISFWWSYGIFIFVGIGCLMSMINFMMDKKR